MNYSISIISAFLTILILHILDTKYHYKTKLIKFFGSNFKYDISLGILIFVPYLFLKDLTNEFPIHAYEPIFFDILNRPIYCTVLSSYFYLCRRPKDLR